MSRFWEACAVPWTIYVAGFLGPASCPAGLAALPGLSSESPPGALHLLKLSETRPGSVLHQALVNILEKYNPTTTSK